MEAEQGFKTGKEGEALRAQRRLVRSRWNQGLCSQGRRSKVANEDVKLVHVLRGSEVETFGDIFPPGRSHSQITSVPQMHI